MEAFFVQLRSHPEHKSRSASRTKKQPAGLGTALCGRAAMGLGPTGHRHLRAAGWASLVKYRSTRQFAGMPTRHRLPVAVALEQFSAADHLRVSRIANLEPCALFAFAHIRAVLVFRNDALQIQLADALEQRRAVTLDVIYIEQSIWSPSQYTPQFCLTFHQRLCRQSLPSQNNRSNAEKQGVSRRNNSLLNWECPRRSRQTISPSMTASRVWRSAVPMQSANSVNEVNGCPLRDTSRPRPWSTCASARKPSYFSSKIQFGSSKASRPHWSGMETMLARSIAPIVTSKKARRSGRKHKVVYS